MRFNAARIRWRSRVSYPSDEAPCKCVLTPTGYRSRSSSAHSSRRFRCFTGSLGLCRARRVASCRTRSYPIASSTCFAVFERPSCRLPPKVGCHLRPAGGFLAVLARPSVPPIARDPSFASPAAMVRSGTPSKPRVVCARHTSWAPARSAHSDQKTQKVLMGMCCQQRRLSQPRERGRRRLLFQHLPHPVCCFRHHLHVRHECPSRSTENMSCPSVRRIRRSYPPQDSRRRLLRGQRRCFLGHAVHWPRPLRF